MLLENFLKNLMPDLYYFMNFHWRNQLLIPYQNLKILYIYYRKKYHYIASICLPKLFNVKPLLFKAIELF